MMEKNQKNKEITDAILLAIAIVAIIFAMSITR